MLSVGSGLADAARWLLAPARRKWVVAVIGTAAVITIFMLFRHYRQEARQAVQERDAAVGSVVVLERAKRADDAAVVKSEDAKRVLQSEEAKNSAATEIALAENPDWAGQLVPVDVLGSLLDNSP